MEKTAGERLTRTLASTDCLRSHAVLQLEFSRYVINANRLSGPASPTCSPAQTSGSRVARLRRFACRSGGCAGVAARCRALPRFAHLARKIIRIPSVFEDAIGLLICGLKVRFLPGSPFSSKDLVSFSSRGHSRELR